MLICIDLCAYMPGGVIANSIFYLMPAYHRMDGLTDNMTPEEKREKGLYPRVTSRKTVL
ncbi:MAG: hypothetical protein LBH90_05055 [Tannerella sp.]|jgi:hypothetical protein|nr:hypothetical protein [Tannerella sp.]